MRVLVVGYYGYGNAGDEAVLAGLRSVLGEAEVKVASGDPARTRAEHPGVSAVPLLGPEVVATAAGVDLVVIGGGGLLNDVQPFDPLGLLSARAWGLAAYMTPAVAAALAGVPYVVWGVGVGPLRDDDARDAVRGLLALAAGVTVRDELSAATVAQIGAARPPVCADLATVLTAADLPAPTRPADVAIVVRAWQNTVAEQAARLRGLLEALPADLDVVVVPFQDGGADDLADDDLAAQATAGTAARVVGGGWRARLGAVRTARVTVAMRYHAVLAAAIGGRPFVALAYDPKVASLATDIGAGGDVVEPDALGAGLATRVTGLLERAPRASAWPAEAAARVRAMRPPLRDPRHLDAARAWAASTLVAARDAAYGDAARDALRERLAEAEERLAEVDREVYGSRGWRLLSRWYALRDRVRRRARH